MKSKNILIISFFSVTISLLLFFAKDIIQNFPLYALSSTRKEKILEFINPFELSSYLTKLTIEKQDLIEQIWDYKNNLNQEIKNLKNFSVKEIELDSNSLVKLYTKNSQIIKVEHNFRMDDGMGIEYFYLRDNKIVLYHYCYEYYSNKDFDQVFDFISNKTLLYESRIPKNCILADEKYIYTIVNQINEKYHILLNKVI
jgi:methionine synthase II (cobalamin-independent)